MPKTWTDDTNLTFGPGDCLDVDGAIYLYTGTKAQTWANKRLQPDHASQLGAPTRRRLQIHAL